MSHFLRVFAPVSPSAPAVFGPAAPGAFGVSAPAILAETAPATLAGRMRMRGYCPGMGDADTCCGACCGGY